MSVLLLRLAGPMQAYGTQSRFSVRDTGLEPSKSAVLGLLCSAMGKPRHDSGNGDMPSLNELSALRMGVRIDRPGTVARDFHTALGVAKASGARVPSPHSPNYAKFTVTSNRYYLADAEFLVGLEGDMDLLRRLDAALADPKWLLFLGRKSFTPAMPVREPDGLLPDGRLPDALKTRPWYYRNGREQPPEKGLRILAESDSPTEGEVRTDVPLTFVSADRSFAARRVRDVELWPVPDELIQEWPPCSSPS